MMKSSKSRKRWRNLLGILVTMSSQKWGFSMIRMAFLILMANGFSFTRTFLLVQLMAWSLGCSLKVMIWCTFQKLMSKSCLIQNSIATGPTLVLPCSLAITCSYFIQEMSVMKTGSVTLTRLALFWIKMARLPRLTRSWLTSHRTLLTTSATRKFLISRGNTMPSWVVRTWRKKDLFVSTRLWTMTTQTGRQLVT